jgi:hypothetical protein
MLDALQGSAMERWAELGGEPTGLEFAAERRELVIDRARS